MEAKVCNSRPMDECDLNIRFLQIEWRLKSDYIHDNLDALYHTKKKYIIYWHFNDLIAFTSEFHNKAYLNDF